MPVPVGVSLSQQSKERRLSGSLANFFVSDVITPSDAFMVALDSKPRMYRLEQGSGGVAMTQFHTLELGGLRHCRYASSFGGRWNGNARGFPKSSHHPCSEFSSTADLQRDVTGSRNGGVKLQK